MNHKATLEEIIQQIKNKKLSIKGKELLNQLELSKMHNKNGTAVLYELIAIFELPSISQCAAVVEIRDSRQYVRVTLEWNNYKFEGIYNSKQTGKHDLCMQAIAILSRDAMFYENEESNEQQIIQRFDFERTSSIKKKTKDFDFVNKRLNGYKGCKYDFKYRISESEVWIRYVHSKDRQVNLIINDGVKILVNEDGYMISRYADARHYTMSLSAMISDELINTLNKVMKQNTTQLTNKAMMGDSLIELMLVTMFQGSEASKDIQLIKSNQNMCGLIQCLCGQLASSAHTGGTYFEAAFILLDIKDSLALLILLVVHYFEMYPSADF